MMSELLQPYLPGFSPDNVAPSKFSGPVIDFAASSVRVQKNYGDYRVYLTEEGIRKACTRVERLSPHPIVYQPVSVFVESDEPDIEVFQLNLTRDSSILWNHDHHADIVFERDQEGPLVWVYTPRIGQLLEENPQAEVMTRYDGHTNKIFIMRDPWEVSNLMLAQRS